VTESAAALPRPWRGRAGWIRLLGPAFVASVAYVDHRHRPITTLAAAVAAVVIVGLNVALVALG
jgi:Mn2+/Fe2+ NRAMP family transporter